MPGPTNGPPAVSVGDRAADDLRFIRQAMERSTTFTAVPGAGGAAMGVLGLAAAAFGSMQPTPDHWLAVWLGTALVAFLVGVIAIVHKAKAAGLALTGRTPRNFALALIAPLAAGAGVTFALWSTRNYAPMPAAWLLTYGAGVVTGGVFTVPVVRLTGLALMACGLGAALTPPVLGNVWLGIGFGGLHLVGGIYIARNHGG